MAIDEKKLIEEMEKTFPDKFLHDKNWFCGKRSFMDLFKELIEEFVPKIGEWIPCSERLPEEGEEVLVQFKGKNEVDMAVGWNNGGYICCWDDRIIGIMDEVAWMPLPEPYKEEVTE